MTTTPESNARRGDVPGGTLAWQKSSYSAAGGHCVETAHLPGGHQAVRDSKDKDGPVLVVTPQQWRSFVGGIKNGAF
jgi:uncharacterized protein DUF397